MSKSHAKHQPHPHHQPHPQPQPEHQYQQKREHEDLNDSKQHLKSFDKSSTLIFDSSFVTKSNNKMLPTEFVSSTDRSAGGEKPKFGRATFIQHQSKPSNDSGAALHEAHRASRKLAGSFHAAPTIAINLGASN